MIFHDDSDGKSWNNSTNNSNLNTNWNNAQKSERLYLDSYKVKRFSHTFTTGTNVGTTRVGLTFPHIRMVLELCFMECSLKKETKCLLFTPTPIPLLQMSQMPHRLLCKQILKEDILILGFKATYIVTVTLDQSIIDSAQELYNQVTANIEFVTPSGLTVTMTSVSDDPSTPAVNDPTFTNLDNLKGIEVVKEVKQITDTNSNGQNDAGDVIKYEVTLTNTGQTNLADFQISDILQTSTGTKSIEVDPFVGKSQNYFWYSWSIDDNDWNWSEHGSIYGNQVSDNNYGSIPYKLVDHGSTSYIQNTLPTYNVLPSQGVTNNSNDDHTYMWYLYVNGSSSSYDDDYVYKTMRLKPNTTYTISVYGKKTAATIAPWHFVIHDGKDTNYNWADAIKSQDFELEQTTYLNRYTYTFTTSANAGTHNARVGLHPPTNALGSNSRFWGIQLEEGEDAGIFIYNYDKDTNRNWKNEVLDGVTYSYTSYGDRYLKLYEEESSADEEIYNYFYPGYPNSNASPSTNRYNYAYFHPTSNSAMYINTYYNRNWRFVVEIENQSSVVTNVSNYNYIGEYQGHHYFSRESSSYYWYQAANTINSDFSQYGKDAYLYIPNSEAEHNFVKAQLTSNYYWLGLLKDSYDDPQRTYFPGWRDVKGNYMYGSESRDYVSTIPAGNSIKFTYDYTITTEDVNAGVISNSIIITSRSQSITDISDDGDDSDGNTEDDPTETTMFTIMSMEATKTVSPTDVNGDGIIGVGDKAVFTLVVSNTGNTDITSLQLSDTLTDLDNVELGLDGPITLTDSYTLNANRSVSDSGTSDGFENMTSFYNGNYNSDWWYTVGYFNKSGSNFTVNDIYFYYNMPAIVEVDELTNEITNLATNNNDYLIGQYNGHSYFRLE